MLIFLVVRDKAYSEGMRQDTAINTYWVIFNMEDDS